ncbi:hypothetical protein D3C81_2214460 [compost metagenome]
MHATAGNLRSQANGSRRKCVRRQAVIVGAQQLRGELAQPRGRVKGFTDRTGQRQIEEILFGVVIEDHRKQPFDSAQ